MKKRSIIDWPKKTTIIDLIFLAFIFLNPLIQIIYLEFDITKARLNFVLLTSLWILFKTIFSNLKFNLISLFDIGLWLIFIYSLIHFYVYSSASFYYYMLWVYIAYFTIFYLFRWALQTEDKSNFVMHFILFLIIGSCLIESITGVLQYFELLKISKDYFEVLGSFSSPNFFGAYLGFGFIILIWYLLQKNIANIVAKLFIFLGLVLLGSLIIISNSRGAWLSILSSLLVLLFTSKWTKENKKKLSITKTIISFVLIVFLVFFGIKYLFALKPESVKGRIFTTEIALKEIIKEPLFGHGLFSFAGKYNRAKANYFMDSARPWDEMKIATYNFTAYNDYTLVAFELGLFVLFTLLGLIFLVIIKLKITEETRLGLSIFLGYIVFAIFNSPVYSVYITMVGIFGLALMFRFGEIKFKCIHVNITMKKISQLLILFIGFLGVYMVCLKLVNEKRYKGITSLRDSSYTAKLVNLSRTAEDNFYSDYILGKKLFEYGEKEEGLLFMEKAFQKSSLPNIGKELAICYISTGNYKRAEEIFKFNISVEPYRFEARMNLLRLLLELNRLEEAVILSNEIKMLPEKVPSKIIVDYKNTATQIIKRYYPLINPESVLKGSLSLEKNITSSFLNKTLPYKVYLPPIGKINEKLPVIYVNDGYSYIENARFPEILDSLIINNIIEPVVAVFLEPRNKNRENIRNELFICNLSFAKFYKDELIPIIEKTYPVSSTQNHRSVLGVSFGGLAAAYIADAEPSVFKNIIMQSPALHACKSIYGSYSMKPKRDFKIYLSYGNNHDTENQNIPLIRILKFKNYDFKVNRIENGSHNWDTWQKQIDDILIYFFELNKVKKN